LAFLTATCNALTAPVAATYYVDCQGKSGDTKGAGTTQEHPITTLDAVNRRTFLPGETILFKRGSACEGTLAPRGSGRSDAPIRIAAFGEGEKPRIHAVVGSETAMVLFNQEYWEIGSLDVSGGTREGVHIGGDHGVLHHIHLVQLTVHDVVDPKAEIKKKSSGLVVIDISSPTAAFDDVLVDGVIAYRTNQWSGIFVSGGDGAAVTSHAVVRNSMVHDVQGDGIVLFHLRDGLIENSVAWHTGMQHTQTLGTPNAIWTWACDGCTVRNNEAFLTDSPGIDAGAFDIDYWNTNNKVIDNYGHDTQGYCVSVFAAYRVTRSSEVSGNLCIRNGLSPRLAAKQGAVFLLTWQSGGLDGVGIRDNVIYWDPPGRYPAIQTGEGLDIKRLTIAKNIIYSSVVPFVSSGVRATEDSNRFIYVGRRTLTTAPSAERSGAIESMANPVGIACWGGCSDAGKRKLLAAEKSWIANLRSASGSPVQSSTRDWMLYASIPEGGENSARELILLKSQSAQFRAAGLRVIAVCRCSAAELQQLDQDWQLAADGVEVVSVGAKPIVPQLLIVAPDGELARDWHEFPSVREIGLALRQIVGEPVFAGLQASQEPVPKL
jgi:hypothetical protein